MRFRRRRYWRSSIIERNEIVLDRDTVLDKDNVEEILEVGVKPFFT
ncbi:hypothetical protein [Mesoflavibacter zeaxanthinifaciens]